MFEIRRGEDRGVTRWDWLESYHSFAFGEYQNPKRISFGPLRVINDDLVAPGQGFGMHGHRDMEILTYVLRGTLEHRDSEGNHGVIRPYELQMMRAGTGIRHSEFNGSQTDPVHLLQIWIHPEQTGLAPAYAELALDFEARNCRWAIVASPDGRDGSVRIAQDASMFVAHLLPGEDVAHAIAPGRRVYLHVATGEVYVDGEMLTEGDAVAIAEVNRVEVNGSEVSEVILFDLP